MTRGLRRLVCLGTLLALLAAAPWARALKNNVTLYLLAINDEVALVDYRTSACSDAQSAWLLVDLRSGAVRRFVHEQSYGTLAKSCAAVTAELQEALATHHLDGVVLDAAQCGAHDDAWQLQMQALLDADFGRQWNADPSRPNLVRLTKERAQQTSAAIADGPFAGRAFAVSHKGTRTTLRRDGKLVAELTHARGADPQSRRFVAVSPGGKSLLVGHTETGQLEVLAVDARGQARTVPPTAR